MKTLKTNTIKLFTLLFISSFALSSCSNDTDDDPNQGTEEELITTVTYILTSSTDIVTLEFKDLDGEGGTDGTYSVSGPLTTNSTYTGSIKFLNETQSPAEDITTEVQAEGDEHEIFFASNIAGMTIEKTDQDNNGNPVGITTSLTTGDAGAGTMTIVLKHEPTKPNNGTSANAGGSTDAEVTFNISVQ